MNILKSLESIEEDIISWRRELHMYPELGTQLPKTADFVASKLKEFGIDFIRGVGVKDDLVGLIKGSKPGKTIAFRADMDGLPIKEETGLDFASRNNCMHACGHDAHTAILLGAAKFINENKDKLSGNIVLIFQTGEELSLGARPIVESGILEKYQVEEIYGLHVGGVDNKDLSGKVFINPGPAMACLDRFKITVKGKGSHGANPQNSIDPITIASYLVTSIQEIISREVSPLQPSVISIGSFKAGSSYNIIPEKAEIEGTARAVSEDTRNFISRRIGELSENLGTAFRAKIDFEYIYGAPPLINNKELSLSLKEKVDSLFGPETAILLKDPVMGGEDFAEYLKKVPGVFFSLQSMQAVQGKIYPHHNPKFDLDEDQFIKGAAIFAKLAFTN